MSESPNQLIVVFDVRPRSVEAGQSVTITWETQDVAEVKLEPTFGAVVPSGQREVEVIKTTDFGLLADGEDGTQEFAKVTVTVTGASA
jgi:hypothetical protein